MMTTTLPVLNPVTAYVSFDLSEAAWLISEAKLKFCGAHPRKEKSNAMFFLFDDPDQQGLKLREEFTFGRATANVLNYTRARTMLVELIQQKRRGGFDANPR